MQADQVKLLSSTKAFGGFLYKYSHPSYACNCEMKFNIYLPAAAVSAAKNKDATKYPALYFLSGLTCNEDNFMIKSGAIKVAAEKNLILIAPDTSPRGCNIQGEDESWDMGVAASYYLDATVNKWSNNYRMYTYITKELPQILNADFPIDPEKVSLSGHSVGGHGALTVFLKNPQMYKSVSAFATVSNPTKSPWGVKAFTAFLGSDNEQQWNKYDATELAKVYKGPSANILIDQGSKDQFFIDGQLLPDHFVTAAKANQNLKVEYRLQENYDHGYYFVSTFIASHIDFHLKHLK